MRHFTLLAQVAASLACGPTVGIIGGGESGESGGAASTGGPTQTDAGPGSAGESGGVDPDGTTGEPLPPLPPPPDCVEGTVVDPWLHIDGTDLDERASLDGVTVVDGDLIVRRTPDSNLDFLQCVRQITGDLYIHDNDNLTDVSGLTWVQSIGGDIVITDNDALIAFDVLTLVPELGLKPPDPDAIGIEPASSLIVLDNDALERIQGLSGLGVVMGNLLVRDNPVLTNIDGLLNVTTVGGNLAVNHNASLCISTVNILGMGITDPAAPPASWTTLGNNQAC
ncbi:MAG: hypothetical protein AAF721_08640 [Myxococcota bacterium]